MSSTEVHIGKLVPTNKTVNEFVNSLKKGPNIDHLSWMTIEDWIYEEFDDKFIILEGQVWEVRDESIDGEDIFKSTKNPDGTVDYVVRYYNGSCSFLEAIQEALENGD